MLGTSDACLMSYLSQQTSELAYCIVDCPISELGQCPGNSHTIWDVGQMDIGHVAAEVHYLLSLRELH